MPEPLAQALAEVRRLLLDPGLVRAVAAGRRRGHTPSVVRAELRPVTGHGRDRLQLVTSDGQRPTTRNLEPGEPAAGAVEALLAEPFGSWRVESTEVVLQLRVTKSGAAQVHRAPGVAGPPEATAHDRPAAHLLDPGDPLFQVIGGGAAKRRQVDAFLRALAATLPAGQLPEPLHVADLGCGNAYLTFAAYRWLTAARGLDAYLVGVDLRPDQRARNTALAAQLGWAGRVRFVAGSILDTQVAPPHLVLALHACDTATDEALARAVGWGARWVLAAPCCHHDLAAQLRRAPAPSPYQELTRHGILRERYADLLTDALRAALLRQHGYRVEVVEFVDSRHTPRNLLLRATRTGAAPTAAQQQEYQDLVDAWSVTPRLATLLADPRYAAPEPAGDRRYSSGNPVPVSRAEVE